MKSKIVNGTPVNDSPSEGKGFHQDAPEEMTIRSAANGVSVRSRKKSKPSKATKGNPFPSNNYEPDKEHVFQNADQLIGHVAKHFKGGMK